LSFSYWIDNLGFITEEKLTAIFIKPSLGVSNWPVIYYTFPRQLGNISFLSLLPRLKKKLPHHHHRAINKAGGTWAGRLGRPHQPYPPGERRPALSVL
jgi:hypothetical protein